MDPRERQAEETRLRRALCITSFALANLENYLLQNGHVPDFANEQAIRDAVLKFRGFYNSSPRFDFPFGDLNFLNSIFDASRDAGQCLDPTSTERQAEKHESESIKYDAVKDLFRMIAVRKAQVAVAQQQHETQASGAAVKEEGA